MSYPYLHDPCGMDADDLLSARLDAEHRAGLHALDPHGDCSLCEASGPEGGCDPFTAHVHRHVDPWLVGAGEFLDLSLSGFLHRVGGGEFDVALRHASDSEPTSAARPCNPVAGERR